MLSWDFLPCHYLPWIDLEPSPQEILEAAANPLYQRLESFSNPSATRAPARGSLERRLGTRKRSPWCSGTCGFPSDRAPARGRGASLPACKAGFAPAGPAVQRACNAPGPWRAVCSVRFRGRRRIRARGTRSPFEPAANRSFPPFLLCGSDRGDVKRIFIRGGGNCSPTAKPSGKRAQKKPREPHEAG